MFESFDPTHETIVHRRTALGRRVDCWSWKVVDLTESPARRKFLRYVASAAVGAAVAGGSAYFLEGGTRDKVGSLSQQVNALQVQNSGLRDQITTLQSEVSSLSQQATSGVLGYVFGSGGQYAAIDLSTQRPLAASDVTQLDGKNLFFANSRLDSSNRVWAGEFKTGKVYTIDPIRASLVSTIQLPGRWAIIIIDLDPAGKYAYALNLLVAPNASDADLASLKVKPEDIAPSVVYKIDTSTQQVVASLEVERFGCDIAVAPDGKFLYIPNQLNKLVTVIDLSTFQVIDSISGETTNGQIGGSMITLSPGGKWLFLEQSPSHNWSGVDIEGPNAEVVIDPSSRKIVKSIPLDESPGIDEFSPDGKYSTVTLRTKVVIIDTNTLEIAATVPVNGPGTLTYSPDSRFAYVPSRKDNKVVVIDLTNFKQVNSIDLPFAPSVIIPYDPKGHLGYKLLPVS